MTVGTEFYDLSHSINHVSFGKEEILREIKYQFPKSGILSQLDGITHYEKMFDSKREHEIFNYYVNVKLNIKDSTDLLPYPHSKHGGLSVHCQPPLSADLLIPGNLF